MAETDDVSSHVLQSSDRVARRGRTHLVVQVGHGRITGCELGAGEATLPGEHGDVVALVDHHRLVTGGVARCGDRPNAGCDCDVVLDEPQAFGFDPLPGRAR